MLKQLCLATGLVLLVPAGAAQLVPGEIPEEAAGEAPPPPAPLISEVTAGDLQQLLAALDARVIAAGENATGAPFIFGQTADGMTFGIYTLCAAPGGTDCRGVEFVAVLGSFASEEQVNAINRAYAAVSLYKVNENTVHLSRYVILDHGVTWENLVENGRVFKTLCATVVARLASFAPEQPE